ncbi:MAG: hypothetical protein ACOCV8_04535 [Spirochaetota bacterium]
MRTINIALIGLILLLFLLFPIKSFSLQDKDNNDNDTEKDSINLVGMWDWPEPVFAEGVKKISHWMHFTMIFKEDNSYEHYNEKAELIQTGVWKLVEIEGSKVQELILDSDNEYNKVHYTIIEGQGKDSYSLSLSLIEKEDYSYAPQYPVITITKISEHTDINKKPEQEN